MTYRRSQEDKSGNIWVKQSSDKRRITENTEILSLFQQSGTYHPDEKGVRRTTIADIDTMLLNEYLEKYYGKQADQFGMPINQLLENLQIMTADGQLTLAGLMFFGRHPELREPAFIIKAVSFFGNDMGGLSYRNSKDITGTIPQMFEQGMTFLTSNLRSLQAGQSFNSIGKLEISEVALRELLQNALVHRDYLIQAPIRIMIFDNRVEIASPGGLPKGISIDNIRFGKTSQRNSLVASFCAKTMDYRGLGTGIMRALKEEKNINFQNDEDSEFKVIITRPQADRPDGMYVPRYVQNTPPISQYDPELDSGVMIASDSGPITNYNPALIRRYCPDLGKGEDDNARYIVEYCRQPQGILEMMGAVGYRSRTSFRRRILDPLIEGGLIEPLLRDRPNSPKQRYMTIPR